MHLFICLLYCDMIITYFLIVVVTTTHSNRFTLNKHKNIQMMDYYTSNNQNDAMGIKIKVLVKTENQGKSFV